MERERIEMLIKHHELIRDRYAGSNFACTQQEAIEVLRLALLAIDSERARRVGEAVLVWCNGFDSEAGTHAECMDRIAATCPGTSDAYFALRMLAAALRGEP